MCRCWCCKERLSRTLSCETHEMTALDESRSRAWLEEERGKVDIVNNNRFSWGKGVAVEVYSKSVDAWFPGKIIEVKGDKSDRKVKVVYNNNTKSVPLFSSELRPLRTIPSVSQLSFGDLFLKATNLLEEYEPQIQPIILDAFVSYSQDDAQDAVALLYWLLKSREVKTWVDQQQADISVKAMSSGISKSRCFIIFLTKSYFKKHYPVFELETALKLEKQIIVIWEGDVRCGGFSDFKSHIDACPEKYKGILFKKEALKFERRKHLQEAQINKIVHRISQAPENQDTPF